MWSWDGRNFKIQKQWKKSKEKHEKMSAINIVMHIKLINKQESTDISQLIRWWERGNPHKNKQRLSEF